MCFSFLPDLATQREHLEVSIEEVTKQTAALLQPKVKINEAFSNRVLVYLMALVSICMFVGRSERSVNDFEDQAYGDVNC